MTDLEKIAKWVNKFNAFQYTPRKLLNEGSLFLNSKNITSIPREISELRNLKALYLSDNKIVTIPREIGKLEKLEILSLSNNEIRSILREIKGLKNLKSIDFSSNKITTIPKREISKKRAASAVYYVYSSNFTKLWCNFF